MPLKNIKQYLIKTANKFTHLNVIILFLKQIKDFFTVEKAFKDSLKNCLHNNLKRK